MVVGVGNDTLVTKNPVFCHSQCSSFKHGKRYNCIKLMYLNCFVHFMLVNTTI